MVVFRSLHASVMPLLILQARASEGAVAMAGRQPRPTIAGMCVSRSGYETISISSMSKVKSWPASGWLASSVTSVGETSVTVTTAA